MASTLAPTVAISTLVPSMSGDLMGCPTVVIEQAILYVAKDLCQRGKVWVSDLPDIALVPGVHEYALDPGVLYCEATDIVRAAFVDSNGARKYLPFVPYGFLVRSRPSWPAADEGQPVRVTAQGQQDIQVAPVPTDPGVLLVTVNLRPTADATELPEWFTIEFWRVLYHGVLHRLMLMPQRSWSDDNLAAYHGKQWSHMLSAAKLRAATEYNAGTLSVVARPFA